jgi:hypothetical protein
MDPMTMMAIMSALSAAGSAVGKNGEFKSSYNNGQLGLLDQIRESVMGMKGNQDITQNQGYQQGQGWLNSLFNDQDFFNKFEAPMQRQFEEQTVPDLANRFASQGSGGSLGSTGFRNQLAREGSNLQTNMAAQRGQMQQQGVNQQLGYSQQPFSNLMTLLQSALQPTQNVYQGPSNPFSGIVSAFAGGASQGYGQQWGQSMAPQQNPGQNPNTY